jgi:hypothetical protein
MHTFGLANSKSPTNRNRDTLFWGFGAIRSRTAEVTMSGVQSVSTERLGSLLGHVTHRGFLMLRILIPNALVFLAKDPRFIAM